MVVINSSAVMLTYVKVVARIEYLSAGLENRSVILMNRKHQRYELRTVSFCVTVLKRDVLWQQQSNIVVEQMNILFLNQHKPKLT
jgi:hypothetical protein